MNSIALWIGNVVMVSGGLGIAVMCLSLAMSGAWRLWNKYLNMADVAEALSEWKVKHPEKLERWKKRNDVE